MFSNRAMTLVELLTVVAIIGLLLLVMVPTLSTAVGYARLACCSGAMRNVHSATMSYAGIHSGRMPPFAFSDYLGDLPLSGHWGGSDPTEDPGAFGRVGVEYVNLWSLEREELILPSCLVCPAAAADLADGRASYFHHTRRYSTYCLRFPYSRDLFNGSDGLWNTWGFSIYGMKAGGLPERVGQYYQDVPQVEIDRSYRLLAPADAGDGVYDVASDAMLADAFWRRDYFAPAPDGAARDVSADWCHGDVFNVAFGDGSVKHIRDDGVVAANCRTADSAPADDGAHYATHAERIWQFFDSSK